MLVPERKVNGTVLKLPAYSEFARAHRKTPNDLQIPDRFRRLSSGRVGHKSLGIVFMLQALSQGYALAGEHTNKVVIPKSWVLGTDTDAEFLEKNKLHRFLESYGMWPLSSYVRNYSGKWAEAAQIYFSELIPAFIRADLSDSVMESLVGVANSHWPKAIRSTHDLEDNPKHMMAGRYFSTFSANLWDTRTNVEMLAQKVKRVLASSFNPDSVAFRESHGLLDVDSNMAVLLMNVFGKWVDGRFAPDIAGMVFTRNFVPWCERITYEDPVVRLVYGMATRAVAAGGYARELSLSAPTLRAQVDVKDIIRVSQEKFEAIDAKTGDLAEYNITDAAKSDGETLARISSYVPKGETDIMRPASVYTLSEEGERYFVTFDSFARGHTDGGALDMIRKMSNNLEALFDGNGASNHKRGLDWEGGFLFGPESVDTVGIWQCRSMGHRAEHEEVKVPKNIPQDSTVIYTGKVLGNGQLRTPHIVFVSEEYAELLGKAFDVVRAIDKLDKLISDKGEKYIIIAPGRLGSSQANLGVPVKHRDIRAAKVIVEYPTLDVSPDLSSGTHFLNEFFGSGGMYLAPLNGDFFNRQFLESSQSLPTDSKVVKHIFDPNGFEVRVDARSHKGIIYFK